jgi:ATP-dependent protease ClpP protease subunit
VRPAGAGTLRLEIAEEITPATADYVERNLAAYPGHSVEITVNTVGGDWSASRRIFRSIESHGRRVTAIIEKASSGGALIAMAADYRKMQPWATFFLHQPNGHGRYSRATLASIANEKAALMASGCRIPAARLRRWMDETTTINARRALDIGLVHEVPGLTKPRRTVVFL